jgi:prepilin-type N-terminal cleavage/methylation domain-containing protein
MSVRTRASRQSGETLVEVLVAVSILGIAIVVIVGALGTVFQASSIHRNHATADTVARTAAETLKDRKLAWDSSGNYSVSGANGFNVTVTAKCWNGNSPATFSPCPNSDRGLQQLKVTASGNGATETVAVLKRRN